MWAMNNRIMCSLKKKEMISAMISWINLEDIIPWNKSSTER